MTLSHLSYASCTGLPHKPLAQKLQKDMQPCTRHCCILIMPYSRVWAVGLELTQKGPLVRKNACFNRGIACVELKEELVASSTFGSGHLGFEQSWHHRLQQTCEERHCRRYSGSAKGQDAKKPTLNVCVNQWKSMETKRAMNWLTNTCIHIYIYVYTHLYTNTSIHAHITCRYIHIHIYTCMCIYIYIYIRIHIMHTWGTTPVEQSASSAYS